MLTAIRYKLQSIPASVVLVAVLVIAMYSFYYAIFELIPWVTVHYHLWIKDPDTRHMYFRAGPEAIAATLAVSAILYNFVKADGTLKHEYPVFSIPKMFLRGFLGILVSIPMIAIAWLGFYFWDKNWARIHGLFIKATAAHHIAIHAPVHIVASPSTVSTITALITTDGQKKVIVVLGVLAANVLVMKPFYWNIQNWFGERHLLKHNGNVTAHWYYMFVPAYRGHLQEIYDTEVMVPGSASGSRFADWRDRLNPQNHGLHNEIFLWISRGTLLIALGGGLFIALVVAHSH